MLVSVCKCDLVMMGQDCQLAMQSGSLIHFTRLGRTDRGLALACTYRDEYVTEQGGSLWYEPRVGGGAVFVVELPAEETDERIHYD